MEKKNRSTSVLNAKTVKPAGKHTPNPAVDIRSFLRNEIAHLWPAITNINKLQKECAAVLPQLFLYCQVLQLEAGQLVLATPNAAFASKLKQQLPQLQNALPKYGWQVHPIRIKVQARQTQFNEPVRQPRHLPDSAFQAFVMLEKQLTHSNSDENLLNALRSLLARHHNS